MIGVIKKEEVCEIAAITPGNAQLQVRFIVNVYQLCLLQKWSGKGRGSGSSPYLPS